MSTCTRAWHRGVNGAVVEPFVHLPMRVGEHHLSGRFLRIIDSTRRAAFPLGPTSKAATHAIGMVTRAVISSDALDAARNGAMSNIASPNWCGAQDTAPMVDVAADRSSKCVARENVDDSGRSASPGDVRRRSFGVLAISAASAPGALSDTDPGPAQHRCHAHFTGVAPRAMFCRHPACSRISLSPPRNRSRPPEVPVVPLTAPGRSSTLSRRLAVRVCPVGPCPRLLQPASSPAAGSEPVRYTLVQRFALSAQHAD